MHYDFIEIGTSDFDTFIQTCPDEQVGLSIEPLIEYLDKLPNKPNVTKINAAVSDEDGVIDIYTIPQQYISDDQGWIKGSNSVNHPHPLVKQYFGDRYDEIVEIRKVPKISWKSLISQYNIETIEYLKIDTEGHDHIILNNYLEECEKQSNLFAKIIEFEYYDKVSNIAELDKVVEKFKLKGYSPVYEEFQGVATNLTLVKNEIKTYKHLKGRVWKGGGIPKWIYRSGAFDLENVPTVVKDMYKNEIISKNPGYELFYFSDFECKKFIIEEWGQEYLDLYNILIPTAYKADLFRYLLLYKYGGIWGDFTQVPLVPFDEFITDMNRVFCLDRPAGDYDLELYNAIMMVKPNDEVVANAITISKGNILGRKYCENPLDITGPVVLGQAYRASSCHGSKFPFKIPVGNLNGSKILLNPNLDNYVVDKSGKKVFMKKMNNHRDLLYRKNNKHYYQAWLDKTVF